MAITGSTLSEIDYVVKNTFTREAPVNMAARNHPFFADVKKVGGFTGTQLECPIMIGNVMGVSNTFSDAQANAAAHTGDRWVLTRAKKYVYHEIDAEALYATGDDKGAFVREVTWATTSMIEEWGNQFAFDLYGDGNGVLAQVEGTPSGGQFVCTDIDNALKFEVGMTCSANTAADGSGTARTNLSITAVDEDTGTITYTGGTGLADDDYVHVDGSEGNAIKGLQAWIPDSAPGATAFFGVDRSVHPTRLGGYRVSATTSDLAEALMDLASKIHRRKGRPDRVYMAPTNFTALTKTMDAAIQRDDGGNATFGREYIYLATPAGILKVMSDPDCSPSRAYMLDMRSWELRHLQPLPHMVNDDGQTRLRITDEDGIEMRARGWSQLLCKAPGHNGVVTGL